MEVNTSSSWAESSSSWAESSSSWAESSSILSLNLKVLIGLVYTLFVCLAVVANTLILLVVYVYCQSRSVHNFFISCLAVADMAFALLCLPLTYLTGILLEYWPFSSALCTLLNYTQSIVVTFNMFTMVLITFDKYLALCQPLKGRMRLKTAKYLMLAQTMFALLISAPILMFTRVVKDASNQHPPQCVETVPDQMRPFYDAFNLLLLIVQYCAPLVFMLICYTRIAIQLNSLSTQPPAARQLVPTHSERIVEHKKNLIKMSFMIMIVFLISWTPLQALNMIRFFLHPDLFSSLNSVYVFILFHLLASTSSFTNSFIYAFTNRRFFNGFKLLLCCHLDEVLRKRRKRVTFRFHVNHRHTARQHHFVANTSHKRQVHL
nr:G protein-coupled receptor [Proales similis]